MSWKNGQAPLYVWLDRKAVGAKKVKKGKASTRLFVGQVTCWTSEPSHLIKEFVCYKIVPSKSKRACK